MDSIMQAQRISERARARGIEASQLAIIRVLNNAIVTSVIGGPRTQPEQEVYLAALNAPFTAEDEDMVSSLVAPGHSSSRSSSNPVVR